MKIENKNTFPQIQGIPGNYTLKEYISNLGWMSKRHLSNDKEWTQDYSVNDLSLTQPIKSDEPVFSGKNMFHTVQGAEPEAFGGFNK